MKRLKSVKPPEIPGMGVSSRIVYMSAYKAGRGERESDRESITERRNVTVKHHHSALNILRKPSNK